MPNIFIITVMTEARDKPVAMRDGTVKVMPDQRDNRTWGWYGQLDAALDAVHRNLTDLHETVYDYAVIEETGEGVCPDIVSERWFRFSRSENGYRPCEKPADLRQVTHFAM